MIKSWKECEKESGLTDLPPRPERKIIWRGYKNGEVGCFDSEKEALAFSKLVDQECVNRDEIKAYNDELSARHTRAFKIWFGSLAEEYNYLPTAAFDIIYEYAYDYGHSNGYDAVASKFEDFAGLVYRILKVVK